MDDEAKSPQELRVQKVIEEIKLKTGGYQCPYIDWLWDDVLCLDGHFTADQLRALADALDPKEK